MGRHALLLAAVLAVAACATPARTGFDRVSEPIIAWRIQLSEAGSDGYRPVESARPAVADGVVYAGTSDGWLSACDAGSGRLLWRIRLDGSGIGGLVAADGGVYAATLGGRLAAIDGAGTVRWSSVQGNAFRLPPLLSAGLLIGKDVSDTVVAVDRASGEFRWRRAWGRPVEMRILDSGFAVADGVLYAGTRDGTVVAFDIEKKSERWQVRLPAPESGLFRDVSAGPVVAGARVLAGTNGGMLFALDRETGATVWQTACRRPAPPVVVGDDLVLVDETGVRVLDPVTGEVRRSTPRRGEEPAAFFPPVQHAGRLVYGEPDGALSVWDPGSGRVVAKLSKVTGFTGGAASDGRQLYLLSNRGFLYAVRIGFTLR